MASLKLSFSFKQLDHRKMSVMQLPPIKDNHSALTTMSRVLSHHCPESISLYRKEGVMHVYCVRLACSFCTVEEGRVERRSRKDLQLSTLKTNSPCISFPPSLLCVIGAIYQSDQHSGHSILLHTSSHTTVHYQIWQPVCACNLFTNLQQRAFRKQHCLLNERNGTMAQSDFSE